MLKLSQDAAEKFNIADDLILAPIYSEKSCDDHRNTDRTTMTRIAYQTAHFPNQPMVPLEAPFFSKKTVLCRNRGFY